MNYTIEAKDLVPGRWYQCQEWSSGSFAKLDKITTEGYFAIKTGEAYFHGKWSSTLNNWFARGFFREITPEELKAAGYIGLKQPVVSNELFPIY